MFFTKKVSQVCILLGLAYGVLTLADITLDFMPEFKTSPDNSINQARSIIPHHDQ